MNIKKILFVLSLILISTNLFAQAQSMRRCMLLPVKDSIGGALGFKVFEDVESYLKDSNWCYYESNSEIINILGNYKKNLQSHLENREVLRIVAEKTTAGSLIKVDITKQVSGADVEVRVIGDNGEDIYFREKTNLKTDDPIVIAQTVKNWLDVYEKSIPYDGRIIGVLGHQFTVDIGRASGVITSSELLVIRPTRKRRHPLLKEIVDWDTTKIGTGRVFHVSGVQSQGKMEQYDTHRKLKMGDWVRLLKKGKPVAQNQGEFSNIEKGYEFGKMGRLGIMLNVGTGSDAIENNNTAGTNPVNKKVGGLLLGIDLNGEIWATRHFWAGLELSQKFGSWSKKEGTLVNESNSISQRFIRFKTGYKYLPLGFFYGPQVDGYLGYASLNYGLDTSTADSIGEVSFKGLLMGARGSMPILKDYRAILELGFIFNPKYTEEVEIFGEADSASSFNIVLGGSYNFSTNVNIDATYSYTGSKATFKNPQRSVSLKENVLKVGASFTY